ncbi:hypothetical protein EVAR_10099_1 [Eumeta japonica]|uniref:Uncharacterized protein n=1 Tax=Eumeta variegata TaxID=151549 RepID=A0A4C1UCA0_EUMVA|nr:hypothetical protein EVAR_10099_1 [Eumeta japonica]
MSHQQIVFVLILIATWIADTKTANYNQSPLGAISGKSVSSASTCCTEGVGSIPAQDKRLFIWSEINIDPESSRPPAVKDGADGKYHPLSGNPDSGMMTNDDLSAARIRLNSSP